MADIFNLKYHLYIYTDKKNHSAAVYHVTSAGQKTTGIHSLSVKVQHPFQYPVCRESSVYSLTGSNANHDTERDLVISPRYTAFFLRA